MNGEGDWGRMEMVGQGQGPCRSQKLEGTLSQGQASPPPNVLFPQHKLPLHRQLTQQQLLGHNGGQSAEQVCPTVNDNQLLKDHLHMGKKRGRRSKRGRKKIEGKWLERTNIHVELQAAWRARLGSWVPLLDSRVPPQPDSPCPLSSTEWSRDFAVSANCSAGTLHQHSLHSLPLAGTRVCSAQLLSCSSSSLSLS